MANINEDDCKKAECYGIRLPSSYNGPKPANMLLADIPEKEYIVFEHGPFSFEEECEIVGEKLEMAINSFDFTKTENKPDTSAGRAEYFYFLPESFEKRILPVC